MKSPRFWLAVLVAGIVSNVLDFVVQGKVLTDAYYSKMDVMRHDVQPGWFIFGDFIAVLVLAWVICRVASAFSGGAKGGACAGFYLGVLVNFPTYHFIHLMFKDYAYPLVWISTIYGIVWYVITGAVLGALMTNKAAAAPAA